MSKQTDMMRTMTGTRLVVRASGLADGRVILVVTGIEILMTPDESHQLRDRLQAAELELARMDEQEADDDI